MVTPGEDIPDTTGRPREERRRSNLSVNTNTTPNTNNGPTQYTQQCPTDRPADRTMNFHDGEQHRTNVISEVQQNLMNISNSQNSNDQASNANVCPDCPDHQNPWPRNTDQNRDNQSSGSSDTDSIGHWDNNWHSQKCRACGLCSHTAYNCEKKRNGELYCNRCRRYTHCEATCSVLCNSSTPQVPTPSQPRPSITMTGRQLHNTSSGTKLQQLQHKTITSTLQCWKCHGHHPHVCDAPR